MKLALLIGINYKDIEGSELFGCIDDVLRMQEMLIHEMDFEEQNIIVLRDDSDDRNLYPTKKNILRKMEEFIYNSNSDDELWFHYSGHGSIRRDRSNDEKDNIDSVLIPNDFQTNGVILDDDIYAIIKGVKGTLFLLFDCCHSGSICDLPWAVQYIDDKITKTNINTNQLENTNIYAISGSTDMQLSMENYNDFLQKKVGALTNAFLMLLHNNKYNVSIEDLFIEICRYLIYSGLEQTPILSTTTNKITYIVK
tara:strand:+ start:7869 stop:8627 length:759 start_codon:yes stop_codon:yes gene_type:complete